MRRSQQPQRAASREARDFLEAFLRHSASRHTSMLMSRMVFAYVCLFLWHCYHLSSPLAARSLYDKRANNNNYCHGQLACPIVNGLLSDHSGHDVLRTTLGTHFFGAVSDRCAPFLWGGCTGCAAHLRSAVSDHWR